MAKRIVDRILKNYTRLAFISTAHNEPEQYRERAQSMAEQFGLRYEEIQGSDVIIRMMLYGSWNDQFVIIPPGTTVSFFDFRKDGP
jgi:hypothetical protein